jgi:uncharacterized protein YukE
MGGKGAGDYAVQAYRAYQWATAPIIQMPVHLPDINKMESSGLDAAIDSVVRGILEAVGLMAILDQVTGLPDQLNAAGQVWLNQANAVHGVAGALRGGAKSLPDEWKGQASAAFGDFMGEIVSGLDSCAADMGQAAEILHDAGQECQLAQDLVVMIIREAAEWAAATLAATALADIFTLGLASIAGGLAESAEMAAFVARATEVSEKLGSTLETLVTKIEDLKKTAQGIKDADGAWKTVQAFRKAQGGIHDMAAAGNLWKAREAWQERNLGYLGSRAFHDGYNVARAGAGTGLGLITGLPGHVGKLGLPEDIGSGAWNEVTQRLTQENNLPGDARIINRATGTGPEPPAPYHLPAG